MIIFLLPILITLIYIGNTKGLTLWEDLAIATAISCIVAFIMFSWI